MAFTESDLRAATAAGVLDAGQLDRLIHFLRARGESGAAATTPRFDVAHLLWYAGALIVILSPGAAMAGGPAAFRSEVA